MSTPALRLVNADTGEFHDPGTCQECDHKDDVIAGLQRDIRGWAARYAELRRDRELEAKSHALYEPAKDLFGYWKLKCRHGRSRFTAERFELVRPLLEKYGEGACRKAIEGAAFDPFVTTRKNGSSQRHDSWELIFRDAGKLEDFANRAPRESK